MRILHILHQYLPDRVGGTELYTQTLARYQVEQGHQAAIFTPGVQDGPAGRVTPAVEQGVTVYRAAAGRRNSRQIFIHTFIHNGLQQAFAQVLRQERPELIHVQHLMGLPTGLMAAVPEAGIPYIVTLHDYWYICANAQLLTNYDHTICAGPHYYLNCAHCALARAGLTSLAPFRPALAPLMAWRNRRLRPILANAHRLIAPTHFVRQTYAQLGVPAEKIIVIPHGIDPPAHIPPVHPSDDPDSPFHVAYIGGLSWQKGVHILIEAFNQLPAGDFRLSIVGDPTAFPDYAANLKKLAGPHPAIHFAGRLPHADLWTLLATVDLVVVPSLWYETASLIIQEAFAAGAPVLASDIGALSERVQDGVDGFLFPAGDAAALAERLRQCGQSPATMARLREGIKPTRAIADHCREVMTVYRQALSKSGS